MANASTPLLAGGMTFGEYGSYGLRQYSGWIREEFLPELQGLNAARVYREMGDNSPTIGSLLFAIKQSVRKVEWRVLPASDKGEANAAAEFVDSVMHDMSEPWESFIVEALSMLQYGFAPCEIVYKRRLGSRPESRPGPKPGTSIAGSKFSDGRIGWRRLPIRGQDTILKWLFDENGQPVGMTQQPYTGPMVDIPIEKLLLFRPDAHKNSPEGRSILRSAYRPYFMAKRLEEQEAIMMERLNGFPVMYVPTALMDAAAGTGIEAITAQRAVQQYQKIVTNMRVDEQMGAVIPSDVFVDSSTGKPTGTRMYELQLLTPQGKLAADPGKMIERYKLDMMMSALADFIQLGHEVRGTHSLAETKVDMFYSAISGWSKSIASVINRYGLRRLWMMNRFDEATMPNIEPDLPQRVDLDALGGFVANLSASGMPLFPDEDLQTFLRAAGGMPEETAGTAVAVTDTARIARGTSNSGGDQQA